MAFDPFGDDETRGYLRNVIGEKDLAIVRRLEHHSFASKILPALGALKSAQSLTYQHLLDTHGTLFGAVYPWAGQDRATLAPSIAIAKAGMADLFAHPADVRRAADYALDMARDPAVMRRKPGEVFGILAYAHPFLDGNGRSIMTLHADLARRSGFHVAWEHIGKAEFLTALTAELRKPGHELDALLRPHIRPGSLPVERMADALASNPALRGAGPSR